MKPIKKLFFTLFSQKAYLSVLHRSFYLLFDLGLLKKDAKFKYHYAVKKIIQPDFTVVDLGANLGYFAKNFARLTPKGMLICIEPIPLFYETLRSFLKKFNHVTIHNVALGTEEGFVTMVMPETDGMIRTGLPHIAHSEAEIKEHKTQEVSLVKGSKLLASLPKIDYIKCDIEGYELIVFNEMKHLIEKHQPYIQIEIGSENEVEMKRFFEELGYTQFGISNFKFIEDNIPQQEEGDYFFVPKHRLPFFTDAFIQS